jgi:hypothetical protein
VSFCPCLPMGRDVTHRVPLTNLSVEVQGATTASDSSRTDPHHAGPGPPTLTSNALRGLRPRIKDRGEGPSWFPVPSPRSPEGSTEPAPTSTRESVC